MLGSETWTDQYVDYNREWLSAEARGDTTAAPFWNGFCQGIAMMGEAALGPAWRALAREALERDAQHRPALYAQAEARAVAALRAQFPDLDEADLRRLYHGQPPREEVA